MALSCLFDYLLCDCHKLYLSVEHKFKKIKLKVYQVLWYKLKD
jgi:hypothetical protein